MISENFKAIVDCLPGTLTEIANKSGISRSAVYRYILMLHESRFIYVCGWVRLSPEHPWTPRYARKRQRADAPKPKPIPAKERSAAYRERARKSGEWEEIKAKQLGRHYANRAKSKRDPLVAALFGPLP